ncbi:MAG: trimethylamine methyltransferase family protein [Hyphomicrobiales bacterium]|nr:trimethylamine methyltransferase family protein [Hyphomicrobiales bacterium]
MESKTGDDGPDPGAATAPRRGRFRRGRPAPAAPAYVTRRIPTYDLLDEESLVRVEDAAETILQEVGIEIRGDDEALGLFRGAGADVDGHRMRLPRGLARSLCATAPRRFTQHARNPARTVDMGGDAVVFVPAYGSPFVHDLAGGRRYGTLADFENLVRLIYMIPTLHHSGGTVCEPVDIPVNKRHLDMVYAHLRHSDKALLGSVTTASRAADSIAMCRLVFGDERMERDCVIMGNVNANSPLVWDGEVSRVIRTYAAANQGVVVAPFILGGAMGPATTPGAVALSHAEAMVGVALTQLQRPGAPAVYGNFLSSTALRSGAPTFGTPEPALGSLVVGQLARRLGVPLRCSGAFTSSKLPDGQAMQESALSLMAAILCGGNFLFHAAGWLEGALTMGYEKLVMDADMLGAMATYLGGLTIDDDQLALDAIREVGPGGHFLGTGHTLAHCGTAFWETGLADVASFEQWQDGGGKDHARRAHERWQAMLAEYQAPAMDPAVDEALRDFMDRRKAALPDAWH